MGHENTTTNTAQRLGRLGLAVAVVAGSLAGFTGAAHAAATIAVTTKIDDGGSGIAANCPGGACSLRDAIAYANANAGTTISVPAGVFALNGTQLTISAPMAITGAGAGASGTVIEQAAHSGARVLLVGNSTGNVTVSAVEITGGNLTLGGGNALGGGVLVSGASGSTATLTDDLIDHNSATGPAGASPGAEGSSAGGGGVAVAGQGDFVLSGTGVSDNTATGGAAAPATSGTGGQGGGVDGAGVDFYSTGVLTIDAGSRIAGNIAASGVGGTAPPGQAVGAGGEALGGGLAIVEEAVVRNASISDSTITGNSAIGAAGAHAVSGQSDGAGAFASGGGVYVELDGSVSISGAVVSANTARAGSMGSGGTASSGGVATGAGLGLSATGASITQTAITGNVDDGTATNASSDGGAIWSQTPMTIVDSTLAGNATESSPGYSAAGGAILTIRAMTLASDTIAGNTGTLGGNIFTEAAATFGSTIVANPIGGGVNCYSWGGSFSELTAHGGNLEDDGAGSCGFSPAKGDIVGTSPQLAAPASNGGPGLTLLPAPGSPVLGTGGACVDPSLSPIGGLTVDGRGLPRPAGGPCDIGAVQVQAPRATVAPSLSPASPGAGQTVTCYPGTWSADGSTSLTYAWLRDGTPVSGQTSASYATSTGDVGHELSCVVTDVSAYGRRTSATTTSVPVSAATATGGSTPSSDGGAGGTPVGGTVTAPATGSQPQALSLTAHEVHRLWRTHGRAHRHAKPVGTRFVVTLNAAARVTFTFRQARHHGRTLGHIAVDDRTGANVLKFSGHVGRGRILHPGRYLVAIAARNTAGVHSKTVTLSFTVAK